MSEGSKVDVPKNFGILVFPAFQALDAFGPLDALNMLSRKYPLNLYVISSSLEPVSTQATDSIWNTHNSRFGETIVPTHDFSTVPSDLEVLLVPGGRGVRYESIEPYVEFVKKTYPNLKYLFTVCTGSWIAARAGVLDGKRATSNKASWHETKGLGNGVQWVSHARWVVDGNIWTTSGVSAGIDGIFAWIKEVYGEKVATDIANILEYERHQDPNWDPFAELYGL